MPVREAFGDTEYAALIAAANWYRGRKEDPGYQGKFETEFCNAFTAFMGGGYADAVASGTASVYIALAALDLPKDSEVIISPVTDSGPLNAIILLGLRPVLADSYPGSYNIGPAQFAEKITSRTSCLLAVHAAGEPLDMPRIMAIARARGVKVLEDCSQAPGASFDGVKVGNFGDIAAFSTMYRKSLQSGSSGGIVFTKDLDLHRRGLSHADRGKQVWRTDINQNDPSNAWFPALNFNNDEFSCAIATASLCRLPATVAARVVFCKMLAAQIADQCQACRPPRITDGCSPFYLPIPVAITKLTRNKNEFAQAIAAEGIPLLAQYGCIIADWKWAHAYLPPGSQTPNAIATKNTTFNLFLNERYGPDEVSDIITAMVKVEKRYGK
jgi:dTDP-4-amino-4,6-dideoxygalactose transaminase